MRLLVLAIATLLFLPVSAIATHDDECTSVGASAGNGDAANRDRDDDGLPDAWEKENFGDLCQEAKGDYDHDGISNGAEWERGSDPADGDDPERDSQPEDKSDEEQPSDEETGQDNETSDDRSSARNLSQACKDTEGDEERNRCIIDYCADHRDDKQCQYVVEKVCERKDCAALSAACERSNDARYAKACSILTDIDEVRADIKHIDFSIDHEGRELVNYTIGDTLAFTSITYGAEDEEFKLRQDGARIRFQSDEARLEIHDSATGQFWFRSDEAALVLELPAGVGITQISNGHLLDYGDRMGRIAGDYSIDGSIIIAEEEFRFFSPISNGPETEAVEDAKASGKLGAQAKISAAGSEVSAYDDLDVNITTPAKISSESPLRVVVSAELEEGRTIIIDVDPALMTGPDLDLRYFDVWDDGNQTEVVFRMATSLADVLDPSDDGGQPEYWIVEDEDGIHVMASIPHWSTHAIELASVGEFIVQPSVLIGVAAGIMGVAVASMAMFWPRRQDSL